MSEQLKGRFSVKINGEECGHLWKVNTPLLVERALENRGAAMLLRPFQVMLGLLEEIAARSIELQDPQLLELCLRLALVEPEPEGVEDVPTIPE